MDCEKKLQILLKLGKAIGDEKDLDSLLETLSNIAKDIVDADRASIFILDKEKDELWTRVALGVKETITICAKNGIAGHTILQKKPIIVQDAYSDPRFFKEIDEHTGYTTHNILTVPLINLHKETIGVFQVLNKKQSNFEKDDEKMLVLLADYASSILENAILYKELEENYRKKSQELEMSEERLKVIALTTNDGVWDWDIQESEVSCSSRFYEMLGLPNRHKPFSEKEFLDLIEKKDRSKLLHALKKHKHHKDTFQCEFRIKTSSGFKWVLCKAHSIWSKKHKHIRMLGSNTDITDIKDKEEKLEIAYSKIEKLLETQDIFIKNSIHEINTPIAVINTYLEVLSRDIQNPKYLQRIISATKTLSSIYDDFNFFLNKDKGVYIKETVNLSEFTKSRCDYFDDIAKGNNQTITFSAKQDLFVNINTIELSRIIDNTLSNSIKYNLEKKSVSVTLYKQDAYVILEFQDEGKGVKSPEKVFERYYRENTYKGGFGIGLTVVKEICDRNSIAIEVLSEPNKGSLFRYYFKEISR